MLEIPQPTESNPLMPWDYLLLDGELMKLWNNYTEFVRDGGHQLISGEGGKTLVYIPGHFDEKENRETEGDYYSFHDDLDKFLETAVSKAGYQISQRITALRHSDERLKYLVFLLDRIQEQIEVNGVSEADDTPDFLERLMNNLKIKVVDSLEALSTNLLISFAEPLGGFAAKYHLQSAHTLPSEFGFLYNPQNLYTIGQGLRDHGVIDGVRTPPSTFKSIMEAPILRVLSQRVYLGEDEGMCAYALTLLQGLFRNLTNTTIEESGAFIRPIKHKQAALDITEKKVTADWIKSNKYKFTKRTGHSAKANLDSLFRAYRQSFS